ncbi:TetR/AcrR family transcriptional regulator [Actinoplanes sp. NPDC049316]|uniref:TetR/AcrR family transcriptional regulator n=1 Tax=Actinoplanes sp. NPDC049316 TaxID=3154727 RepID=UPI0034349DD0
MRVRGRYDQLVAAAMELAAPGLPLSVPSLRAVARECGVTPTAVYRHFPSQSSLNRVILMTVDQSFVAAVSAADDPARPPQERLQRFAHAYFDWGIANPGLYQLRFESADQLGEDYVRTDAADKLLAHIDGVIRSLEEPSPATAEDLWVGLHGLVSLRIHKRDRPWSAEPREQIDRLLRAWAIA